MFTLALVRVLTLNFVQSSNSFIAEGPQSLFTVLKYQKDSLLSDEFNFIIFSEEPIPKHPQYLFKLNLTQNSKIPTIVASESSFNCSTLLKVIKFPSNTILIKASKLSDSKLLYHKCSSPSPSPSILAFLLIDFSIDLKNSKELQS